MSQPKTQSPPYVAYTTFKSALKNLEHVPSTIDKSCFPKMSGTGLSQLFGALRHFKMIDDKGIPSADLKTLGDKGCDETKWKEIMKRLVEQYYADQLDALANGTSTALKKSFGDSVGASVVTPACRFLVQAAQDVGINVSPTIVKDKIKSSTPTRRKTSVTKSKPPSAGGQADTPPPLDKGMIEFPIHLPGKPVGRITVPEELTSADLVIINATMAVIKAYAESSSK